MTSWTYVQRTSLPIWQATFQKNWWLLRDHPDLVLLFLSWRLQSVQELSSCSSDPWRADLSNITNALGEMSISNHILLNKKDPNNTETKKLSHLISLSMLCQSVICNVISIYHYRIRSVYVGTFHTFITHVPYIKFVMHYYIIDHHLHQIKSKITVRVWTLNHVCARCIDI